MTADQNEAGNRAGGTRWKNNIDSRVSHFREKHKAAFFALCAIGFWYIGSRAEAIWHFGERKLQSDRSGQPTLASGSG